MTEFIVGGDGKARVAAPRDRSATSGQQPSGTRTRAPRAPAATSPDEEAPRVLNLRSGAAYLGISYWSLRDLVINGHVPAVRLPCPRTRTGRIMRRLLVDRRDLDALIDRSRERHE